MCCTNPLLRFFAQVRTMLTATDCERRQLTLIANMTSSAFSTICQINKLGAAGAEFRNLLTLNIKRFTLACARNCLNLDGFAPVLGNNVFVPLSSTRRRKVVGATNKALANIKGRPVRPFVYIHTKLARVRLV